MMRQIEIGDEVRAADNDVTERGTVVAIARGQAVVVWDLSGLGIYPLDLLRRADTPIDAPAPALLTGAQVAQVLEALEREEADA